MNDTWTDRPITDGLALIGDAAGYSDPHIGQGLSVALRDVRVLSELLLAGEDWSPAALRPYAEERAERMRRLRFCKRSRPRCAASSAQRRESGAAGRGRVCRRSRNSASGDARTWPVPIGARLRLRRALYDRLCALAVGASC